MSTTNTLDLNNRIDALEKIAHNVEPIQQQIDELKAWTDPGTKDVNGNPIILTDGAAFNAEGLAVTCNPKQNLHGYDHPWAGGAGKNKLPMTVANLKERNTNGTWTGNTYSYSGVDYAILTDSDGNVTGIGVTGSNTSGNDSLFWLMNQNISGSFKLNGCPADGSRSSYNISVNIDGSWVSSKYDTGSGSEFDVTTELQLVIAIRTGQTNLSKVFYPMIRLASVSDATFAPYSNECPITGLTECVADVKDEDETTQHTATITFGQTVYGGSVDFKTGKVTVTHGIITYDGSSDENWLIAEDPNAYFFILKSDMTNRAYSGLLSNEFEPINTSSSRARENTIWSIYQQIHIHPTATITPSGYTNDGIEELKTWLSTHNLQVAYELATPIGLTLTPAELELLKGYNYITTNGDNIDLTYQPDNLKADILLTVSQLYGSKISIFDGILTGGDTGQVLTKTSDDNYDATWETLPATRSTTKKS